MVSSRKKKGFSIEDLLQNDEDGCFKKSLISVETSAKFKLKRRIYKILFERLGKCPDPKQTLLDNINEILRMIIFEAPSVTKVGLSLQSTALSFDLDIPFSDIKHDIIQLLDNNFFKLQQSEKLVPLFDTPLHLSITTYTPPHGSRFDPLMGSINLENLINVEINDNFCLFHALTASMSYHTSKTKRNNIRAHNSVYNNVSRSHDSLTASAMDIMSSANIPTSLSGYGLEHVKLVQDYFKKTFNNLFCILIFGTSSYTKPIFAGDIENPTFYLSLFYFKEHFYAIKNLNLFCSGNKNKKYCPPCRTVYTRDFHHQFSCPRRCPACLSVGNTYPCPIVVKTPCFQCSRIFPSEFCLSMHRKKNICGKIATCLDCYSTYRINPKIPHKCGEAFCRKCHVIHPKDNYCFIQKAKLSKPKTIRFICFDMETRQDSVIEKGVFEHEVNYICAFVFCTECLKYKDFMSNNNCKICGTKVKKWSAPNGDNCIHDFTKWVIFDLPKEYPSICLSHYGGRFDNIFVLRQLFKFNLNPICVKNGNKFFEIRVEKTQDTCETVFKDTFNFMSVPLSSLVKTFDLPVKPKNYFPHLFNVESNYSKDKALNHLPDKEFYMYSSMTIQKQKDFDVWYSENYNEPFYLPDQLGLYGTNDVEILAAAVVEFRKLFMDICKMCPFTEGCTMPSVCMKMYKHYYMPEKTLAIVPEFGYQRHSTASAISLKYFAWLEKKTGKTIRHRNSPGGEARVGRFSVDGLMDDHHVIEFYGCAFHGHPKCYKDGTILPTKRTALKEFERTMDREKEIRDMGYSVEGVWECEVREMLKKDPEMRHFFENVLLGTPINPRDAYFGGRCAPHKLYCKKENGKIIKYLDFLSLYPSVNYFEEYCTGIPEVIEIPTEKQDVYWTKPSDYDIRGILKVFCIPPDDLILPVIPYKTDDFLLFPLCRSCVNLYSKQNSRKLEQCTHQGLARGFISTISSIELDLALTKGYVVTKFYSAYNYKDWTTTLFKEYVQKFLKIKTEADGWPASAATDEEKNFYLKTFRDKFNIELNPEKIKRNSSLRYCAKLALNSLWGRFSLRNTLSKVLVSDDPLEIDKIVSGDTFNVSAIDLLDENRVMIVYNSKKDFIVENNSSNIIVSLWTTAAARVRLYHAMDKVVNTPGCQIYYVDTDSLLYECPEGVEVLPTANYLGELTDEIPLDEEIIELVVGGSKQYAYAVRNKTTGVISYNLKLRGITLDAKASSKLHFQRFKQMVLDYKENEYVDLDYRRILPTKTGHVYSKDVTKKYSVVYKKGFIDEDLIVLPYGYKRTC